MLIDKKKVLNVNEQELFNEGVQYINSHQWIFAYAIFQQLNTNSSKLPVSYNLALCYYFSKEYDKALAILDKLSIGLSLSVEKDILDEKISKQLIDYEFESDNYFNALSNNILDGFHSVIKLRIKRLMCDIYLQQENWQMIMKIALFPLMNRCGNVQMAIEKAQYQTNKSK